MSEKFSTGMKKSYQSIIPLHMVIFAYVVCFSAHVTTWLFCHLSGFFFFCMSETSCSCIDQVKSSLYVLNAFYNQRFTGIIFVATWMCSSTASFLSLVVLNLRVKRLNWQYTGINTPDHLLCIRK